MTPRRRDVERATRRQSITDRVLVVALAIVATSGLMSILPGDRQLAVSRLACQAASLGLGRCGAAGLDLQNTQLNASRCPALATLDTTLPEVRVAQLTTEDAVPVSISGARSGEVFVQLGGLEPSPAPFLLEGDQRAQREVVAGVTLPTSSEWFLPGGQGLDELVEAVHDRHQQWVERRSALAVLSLARSRSARTVPVPTLSYGQARLAGTVLPRFPDGPAVPLNGQQPPASRAPRAPVNAVSLVPDAAAATVFNRVSREFSAVAPLQGVVNRTPVTGLLRWTRDAGGNVTSVVVALVSPVALVRGEATGPSGAGTRVAFVSIPVRTPPERALAQAWLSDPAGFRVGLDELLGLRAAAGTDRLTSFLTRAATVTVLRYSGVAPAEAQQRVSDELIHLRRTDWAGTRLLAASTVAPQPGGSARKLVPDPLCPTP